MLAAAFINVERWIYVDGRNTEQMSANYARLLPVHAIETLGPHKIHAVGHGDGG